MKVSQQPREWQSEALRIWVSRFSGVVSVVTGGGKTVFALLCIEQFVSRYPLGRVLIVAPTAALTDQWFSALVDDYGVEQDSIAIFGGGRSSKIKTFNIAIINSARNFSALIASSADTFLIVDECHRAGSPENAKALQGTYAATLGLSATPEREYDDGFKDYVEPVLGNIIFSYGYKEASSDGVITDFDLLNVQFDLTSTEKKEYKRLSRLIARHYARGDETQSDESYKSLLRRRARVSSGSPLRVPLCIKIALMHRSDRIIIFHEAIDSAEEITKLLTLKGVNAVAYHSKIGPTLRRENLRLFRKGLFTCLVTCRALDEGLNVPTTSVGIIASSTASMRQRIQRLGRVLRPAPGKKKATIYTLYATDTEKKRLEAEAHSLQEISDIVWLKASIRRDG